ncbi:MAG: nucleoside 2-deoxyribosyltransferase [Candidatus Gottesmanbacteria bacterium]
MRIFFAGPLTDLKNPETTKSLYKDMASVAKTLGFDYFWAFLNGTDPIENPDVPSRDVYNRDIAELDASDIMIAYIGEATTGTGIEIEHAYYTGKPVIVLYEQGKKVSRMLLGCPAIKKEIVFSSKEDALAQLRAYLISLK